MKAAAGTMDRLRLDLASRSTLAWTLRIGAFMCFVGHGAFGILTKRAWLPYFAVAHVGPDSAYRLMPIIGTVDVIVGTLALVSPIPAIGVWMTAWAVWTSALRPLSGESGWEAFERAGNYGVPVALLLLLEHRPGIAAFFTRAHPRALDADVLRRLRTALLVAVVFLLVGHGMLGLSGKPGQVANYASVFATSTAVDVTRIAGALEILLAAIVVFRPSTGVLLLVAAWKLGTESLFITAGAPIWEVVERGGSYAAPLALAIVAGLQSRLPVSQTTDRGDESERDRPRRVDVRAHRSPA